MEKRRSGTAIGIGMVIVGLVLYLAFREIETPVIGLRQAGVVIAVLGVIELAVIWWDRRRSR